MTTAAKVRSIGRGLVMVSILLILLRVTVYIAGRLLILAGYIGGGLFLGGLLLWLIGSVMTGYSERS